MLTNTAFALLHLSVVHATLLKRPEDLSFKEASMSLLFVVANLVMAVVRAMMLLNVL